MSTPKIKDFAYVTYKKYNSMMGRCYRETDRAYHRYGGRGIRVCAAWIRDIDSFRSWMAEELIKMNISQDFFIQNSNSLQLDRKDNNSHYTPENCRLTGHQENSRNRSNVRKIFISSEGEEIEV